MPILKNKPIVSIIIVNFNGRKFLARCLQSIFQEKGGYEVIVVDDGSTDGSRQYLRNYQLSITNYQLPIFNFQNNIRFKTIFNNRNLGAAQSRNIGAQSSSGKYLFFLDADTKIKKGWFNEIIHFFATYPKAGIGQAKILKMNTNQFDYAGDFIGPFGFLIERARSAEDRGQFEKIDKIFGLKSAAMIVRKSLFKKLGGFDKSYHIFWEDTDISWRCWLAGYQVLFVPQITVWHAYGTKEKDIKLYLDNRVYYRGCKNNITTLIKNLSAKKLITILPINLICWLVLALLFLFRLKIRQTLAILKGVLANLLQLSTTLKKRRQIQKQRKITDEDLFNQVGSQKSILYYLGKGWAYVAGKPF